MRAKLLKVVALSSLGYINEAFQYLIRVLQDKNLPILWLKESEYLRREKGFSSFYQGAPFYNNLPCHDDKNKVKIMNIKSIHPRKKKKKTSLFLIS